MPTKKAREAHRRIDPSDRAALLKETCRRIRVARRLWDAHRNAGCRAERARALELYELLTEDEREAIPSELRTWLRFRSAKYFDDAPGSGAKGKVLRRRKRP